MVNQQIIKGKLPCDEEKNGECKVIQINCINVDGTINVNDVLKSKHIFVEQQKLVNSDVLIVITGAAIEKIGFWDYDGDYYLGGDIIILLYLLYYKQNYINCKLKDV